jgi:DNA-directed RNA polymerase specialized sigma24 family protein
MINRPLEYWSPEKTHFASSAFIYVRKRRELAASAPRIRFSRPSDAHNFDLLLTEHIHYVESPSSPKKQWVLTKEALDCFLARLDLDRDKAGQKYETVRLRLLKYFEWRGSDVPDIDTDETINRVARKIEEGQNVYNLDGYIYGVARLVNAESLKKRNKKQEMLDESGHTDPVTDEENPDVTDRKACLDRCLRYLTNEDRKIVTEYYAYDEGQKIPYRKQLAARLGISANALRIKAHRLRVNLEACVSECLGGFA